MSSQMFLTWPKAQGQEENRWGWKRDRGTAAPRSPQAGEDRATVGEGEGGKIWENGIETCKISYMKRVTSPGSMQDTGCLGLVHWDDPEGWYREGGGRGVQEPSASQLLAFSPDQVIWFHKYLLDIRPVTRADIFI